MTVDGQMDLLGDEPSGPTLAEAKAQVEAGRAEGIECPCCGQFARTYRRKLPGTSAVVMIAMHQSKQADRDGFIFMPDLLTRVGRRAERQGGDWAKAVHWGMIRQHPGERPDGSKRNGWWKLTEVGRAFVTDAIAVQKYAVVFDNQCLGLEGERVRVRDVLGTRFNYEELLRGV